MSFIRIFDREQRLAYRHVKFATAIVLDETIRLPVTDENCERFEQDWDARVLRLDGQEYHYAIFRIEREMGPEGQRLSGYHGHVPQR